MDPSPKQCSTSKNLSVDASPKAISERTSYLQVRLEFLRYPHLIHALFNVRWCGPPVRFTSPSTCSWVGHMVSGLRHNTIAPYSDSVSLRLRLFNLTSHHIVTRRFILQKGTLSPINGLELVVGTRFQVLFHSPPGVLFTFPSRYWFTIGH